MRWWQEKNVFQANWTQKVRGSVSVTYVLWLWMVLRVCANKSWTRESEFLVRKSEERRFGAAGGVRGSDLRPEPSCLVPLHFNKH